MIGLIVDACHSFGFSTCFNTEDEGMGTRRRSHWDTDATDPSFVGVYSRRTLAEHSRHDLLLDILSESLVVLWRNHQPVIVGHYSNMSFRYSMNDPQILLLGNPCWRLSDMKCLLILCN